MPFIAFLGCDGSGKSAVIHRVAEYLWAEGHKVSLGHWRPKPFAVAEAPLSFADDPHGQPPRGIVGSIVKLGWLWLNWWMAWMRHLGKTSRNGFVLFDRYHVDLMVDPRRYRYGGPMWLARVASYWMPQPDLVIFLDADPDILLTRKQEVGRRELEASRAAYKNVGKRIHGYFEIDASQPLDRVVDLVVMKIQ